MNKIKHTTPDAPLAQNKQKYQKPDVQVIELTQQPALLAGSGIGGKRDGYGQGGK